MTKLKSSFFSLGSWYCHLIIFFPEYFFYCYKKLISSVLKWQQFHAFQVCKPRTCDSRRFSPSFWTRNRGFGQCNFTYMYTVHVLVHHFLVWAELARAIVHAFLSAVHVSSAVLVNAFGNTCFLFACNTFIIAIIFFICRENAAIWVAGRSKDRCFLINPLPIICKVCCTGWVRGFQIS